MRLPSIVLIAAVGLASLAGTTARAQSAYDLAVTNYAKIPAGARYVTDLNENTETTSTAEGALREALAKRGLTYDLDGTIGFKIGSQREVASSQAEAAFDPSNTILHLNLNSGDIKGTPRIGHIYRITLNVYDRGSGSVLARGDVTDHGVNADPSGVTPAMVEELVGGLTF